FHIERNTTARPGMLFVSVNRRPPASPLFPYTTLFRSVSFDADTYTLDGASFTGGVALTGATLNVTTTASATGLMTQSGGVLGGRSAEHTTELQALAYRECPGLLANTIASRATLTISST